MPVKCNRQTCVCVFHFYQKQKITNEQKKGDTKFIIKNTHKQMLNFHPNGALIEMSTQIEYTEYISIQ